MKWYWEGLDGVVRGARGARASGNELRLSLHVDYVKSSREHFAVVPAEQPYGFVLQGRC